MNQADYANYNDLAVAIIEQAVEDYTYAFFSTRPDARHAWLDCRWFLLNGWIVTHLYSDLERRNLVEKIDNMVANGYEFKRGKGWVKWHERTEEKRRLI